ncbi:MAG: hypothetical protein KGS44_11140, partial [Alphaproteobacteria bacterium]|nr:hypothetical protein [Alphaproteobacteria bacterium]
CGRRGQYPTTTAAARAAGSLQRCGAPGPYQGRNRRFVMIEGGSRRAAARLFGIHRETVDKCLAFSAPPGYRQETPRAKPKLGPFLGVIDAILRADADAPPPQAGCLLAASRPCKSAPADR